jgi:uncharacterized membrane protein (UPF0136 family)
MLVLKGLIQYYRTDRKDFIISCLFMGSLFTVLYFGMLLASFLDK